MMAKEGDEDDENESKETQVGITYLLGIGQNSEVEAA